MACMLDRQIMAFIIGISGGSGSGKTTLSKYLLQDPYLKDVAQCIQLDSYYLHQENHHPLMNFDHPDSVDWTRLKKDLTTLRSGHPIELPLYDYKTNARTGYTFFKPSPLLILEGIFAFHDPDIRSIMDLRCFVEVDADTRFIRRLQRDLKERGRNLEGTINQYYLTVKPMYHKFIAPQKVYADLLLGEDLSLSVKILTSSLRSFLDKKDIREFTSH